MCSSFEFPKSGIGTKPVERGQHGVRLFGPVPVSKLTSECKRYFLEELGLDDNSFAYERLFR